MSDTESDLWMIVAIIQPFKLDAVTLALEQLSEFHGITVSDCRGFGHDKLLRERGELASGQAQSRRYDDVREFRNKLRIEVAVSSRRDADTLVKAIAAAAHTGRGGDGKIFVWSLTHAVRIRNLDAGATAL